MNKVASAIFAIYTAAFLYEALPYTKTLNIPGAQGLFWNHLAIFTILFVIAFLVVRKHVSSFSAGNLVLILATLALLGLLAAIFIRIIPTSPVYVPPKTILPYFSSDAAFTAWLVAPLVILFF